MRAMLRAGIDGSDLLAERREHDHVPVGAVGGRGDGEVQRASALGRTAPVLTAPCAAKGRDRRRLPLKGDGGRRVPARGEECEDQHCEGTSHDSLLAPERGGRATRTVPEDQRYEAVER